MKPAHQLDVDVLLVDKAVSLWRAGELVAFPTETVYGLGADATNPQAVAKIYAVKARPRFNPLIVHVADVATAKRYVEWNDLAERLSQKFWPGPFTLVLKRKSDSSIADLVSAGGDTIAIRVPRHALAQQLLQKFGGGIAAPSANRSGRVSPTTAAHVEAELGGAIPLILDGGPCEVGLESTVVDVSEGHAVILRPGSVTREMMEEVTGDRWQVAGDMIHDSRSPIPIKSPGQLEKHYAPSIPVRLNATSVSADEALLAFGAHALKGEACAMNLSTSGNLVEAAANLFSHLRALDDPKYARIAVMPIPNTGIGEAINDRLKRAGS